MNSANYPHLNSIRFQNRIVVVDVVVGVVVVAVVVVLNTHALISPLLGKQVRLDSIFFGR